MLTIYGVSIILCFINMHTIWQLSLCKSVKKTQVDVNEHPTANMAKSKLLTLSSSTIAGTLNIICMSSHIANEIFDNKCSEKQYSNIQSVYEINKLNCSFVNSYKVATQQIT